MSEVARIADQLHRAYEGNAWHGPALRELLADVPASLAAAKPLHGMHSIWEIVLHITVWKKVVRARLGGQSIDLTPEQDWPTVRDYGEAAWKKTLADLAEAQRELHRAVASFNDGRLSETVLGRDHTIYFMLHGLIQHDLYHAGQIAMLKKA